MFKVVRNPFLRRFLTRWFGYRWNGPYRETGKIW
jgi:hypothetical protein